MNNYKEGSISHKRWTYADGFHSFMSPSRQWIPTGSGAQGQWISGRAAWL